MTAPVINKKWTLKSRPETTVSAEHFNFETETIRDLVDGEFLVKNQYLSFEPAQRGWLNDVRSYVPPVAIGEVMRSMAVGEIIASQHADYQVGDRVQGGLAGKNMLSAMALDSFQYQKSPRGYL